MNRSFVIFLLMAAPVCVSAQALEDLQAASGLSDDFYVQGIPAASAPAAAGPAEAEQYLPPDNDEPGFEWRDQNKSLENFIYIGGEATFLKAGPVQSDDLAPGTGKCALSSHTLYSVADKPGFEGLHMAVRLARPLPGCSLSGGYIYMSHVSSSSAGGAWELPRNVRAFLDTLAYAEGTDESYNFIFTHATFNVYTDHPRRRICSGKLCSNAAGRYQFLSKTWDGIAPRLGLQDFTPPSQDKAVVELIRRAGGYRLVSRASVYENFTAALSKLNGTWASLPGSPYGQPTHSTSSLWKFYKAALKKY